MRSYQDGPRCWLFARREGPPRSAGKGRDMSGVARIVGPMFLLVVIAAGCASVPLVDSTQDAVSKTFAAPPGQALIYVVRTGGYISGAYQLFRVALDGRDHGYLSDRTYFLFAVDPGRHSVLAELENRASIQVDTTAGGVYFIGLRSQMGYARARVNVTLLSEEEGKVAIRAAKMAAP